MTMSMRVSLAAAAITLFASFGLARQSAAAVLSCSCSPESGCTQCWCTESGGAKSCCFACGGAQCASCGDPE